MLHPTSPNASYLHNHCTIIKTRKLTLGQHCHLNYKRYLDFTRFSTNVPFILLQDPIQDPSLHLIMSP